MQNWSLRSAKARVIRELSAAEQSEMQTFRHLRDAGEEWLNIKAELGERGMNIADWCATNMPVTRLWLDRHAELYKNWRAFVAAKKWAFEVGYTSHRQSGLEYALELIAAKGRSDWNSRDAHYLLDFVYRRCRCALRHSALAVGCGRCCARRERSEACFADPGRA